MDIGIIGAGRIGSILARHLAALGHQVRIAITRRATVVSTRSTKA